MSAGNTLAEAQVQCLSEIFERAVKRDILEGEIALPDVPQDVLAKYPGILAGIEALEEQGLPGAGEGCVARWGLSSDVRHLDEPADRRRVCLVRSRIQASRWRWNAVLRNCCRVAVLKA